MLLSKPGDLETYKGFIEELTGYNISILETYYRRNTNNMVEEFVKGEFYKTLRDKLSVINNDYKEEKKFELVDNEKSLKMDIKTFENMLKKCYRYDVIYNDEWDSDGDEWKSGYQWKNPINCFFCITDIIRTRIVIRYLDGANKVLNELIKIVTDFGYEYEHEYIAYENGYYGIHFLFKYPLTILNVDYVEKIENITIEIQITTQIKEVVNELLHEYYEVDRMRKRDESKKWQWEYDSIEFLPNYLGHISHYIEGMIIEARQKLRSG